MSRTLAPRLVPSQRRARIIACKAHAHGRPIGSYGLLVDDDRRTDPVRSSIATGRSGNVNDHVVRGFEVEKGRFVPLEEEDLDRLDIELTHSIEICDFVSIDEIDPIYFRQAYMVDLMAALRESVERTRQQKKPMQRKRPARKAS